MGRVRCSPPSATKPSFTNSPVRDAADRRTPPRPRPGRVGLCRLERRHSRAAALRLVPRQSRIAGTPPISRNLLRAAGALAGQAPAKARGATLRRDLVADADRTARPNRGHRSVHLPEGGHGEQDWASLLEAATGPPATRLTAQTWSPRIPPAHTPLADRQPCPILGTIPRRAAQQ